MCKKNDKSGFRVKDRGSARVSIGLGLVLGLRLVVGQMGPIEETSRPIPMHYSHPGDLWKHDVCRAHDGRRGLGGNKVVVRERRDLR